MRIIRLLQHDKSHGKTTKIILPEKLKDPHYLLAGSALNLLNVFVEE